MDKKRLGINFQMSFSGIKPLNKTFEYGRCAIAYAGLNRNRSNISKEAFEKALPTLKNVPLVANYDIETDTLGGHDLKIVTNAEGEMQLINATSPFGLVPESAKQWWEDVDGTEYLMTEVLLWKRSPATQHILAKGSVAQSMEINLYDELGNYQIEADGSCTINNFEFEALCAIGVEPCFEEASVQIGAEKALSSYSEQFSLMLSDLKQFSLEKGGLENLSETVNNVVEEVVEDAATDFDAVPDNANDVSVTAEGVVMDNPDAVSSEGNTGLGFEDEAVSVVEVAEPEKQEFASTYEMRRRAIEQALPRFSEYDENGYLLSRMTYYLRDFDDTYAYVIEETFCDGDWLNKDFKWKYSFDETKGAAELAEVKEEVFVRYLTSEEINQLDTIKATLQSVQAEFDAYKEDHSVPNAEVEALNKFKADTEKAAYRQSLEEIFASFEDLAGLTEFDTLVKEAESEDFALEANVVEEKCFAIRGKKHTKFNKEKTNKTPVLPVDRASKAVSPYGSIF